MNNSYINIAQPFIGDEEWLALKDPLTSGWLTQGPRVKEFEEDFALRHQCRHAVAVTSCTTALHLALLAAGVGAGDRVVVPSFTFVATANAVEYCGAVPVFCDSLQTTYNMDPKKLEDVLQKLKQDGHPAKAVIAVHLFGLIAGIQDILDITKSYGCFLIEDAACAAGADIAGRPAGNFGQISCFSFHPRKIISTGEGGMCLTNDAALAAGLSSLRSHGASQSEESRHLGNAPYLLPDFKELGYNYRLSDLQGAMGVVQLKRLNAFIEERRHWACWYGKALAAIDWLIPPAAPAGYGHTYQAYVCLVDEIKQKLPRNEIMKRLHLQGIASRPGTHAVHKLHYYRDKYKLESGSLPIADLLDKRSLALPLHNKMTPQDYERVVAALKKMEKG